MGIGINKDAADLWSAYDAESYNALFVDEADGYYYFEELPDWAYDPDVGPFYIDDDGAIFAVSTRPSQEGIFIGNLI